MAKKQYYGLKYPFTTNDNEKFCLDVNQSLKDMVRGLVMHVMFTPKNQRIRRPNFGTDLIKYIFEMNDTSVWNEIKENIQETISQYVTNISIDDINILKNEENEYEIYVRIDYRATNGITSASDSIVVKL